MTASAFPALLQRFFANRLITQMEASGHTIASYRDTFRLLLNFESEQSGKMPTRLEIGDLGAELIGDFLLNVETTSFRSRDCARVIINLPRKAKG